MTDQQAAPDWLFNRDVVLLRDVATAVLHLAAVDDLDAFALPYPAGAQRALDALTLQCLRNGATPRPACPRWSAGPAPGRSAAGLSTSCPPTCSTPRTG
ncbi:hypothetical protein NKH77_18850 [Streptomyces sp. M19]